MTTGEKKWMVIGVLLGVAIVTAIGLVLHLRPASQEKTEPTASAPPLPETPSVAAGPIAVQLSSEEQKKIGLQVTEVRREVLSEDIVVPGRVEEPETAISTVSTRFGGRIEQLFVNFTGQTVQQGYGLQLPSDLSPGAYSLIVGVYQAGSGQRLPRADGSLDDFLYLTTLRILPK